MMAFHQVDFRSREYQQLIGPKDPPTAGWIATHMAYCDSCGSLLETEERKTLCLPACTNCGGKQLVRPPAYRVRSTLIVWCRNRYAKLHHRQESPIITPVSTRALQRPQKPELLLPAVEDRKRRERQRREKQAESNHQDRWNRLVDWGQVRSKHPEKELEDLTIEEQVSEAREMEEYNRRHGIEPAHGRAESDMLQELDKHLEPNADKPFTLVKTIDLKGGQN